MAHFMADGDAVYELSIDSVGIARRRLISDSEEAMDAILADAEEEWLRTRPYVTIAPLGRFRRLQVRLGHHVTMAKQAIHDRFFGDGYHRRGCCC
jgi:hypothetical protein